MITNAISTGEGTGFVPSVEEIQAYKERPPILATIELVDGNIIAEDLPITPDFNVGKVLEICTVRYSDALYIPCTVYIYYIIYSHVINSYIHIHTYQIIDRPNAGLAGAERSPR